MKSEQEIQDDIRAVQDISSVSTMLDVICRVTGMGFAAIARVTTSRWVACCVRDDISFGVKPGDELELETTICNEIRHHRQSVIIDEVARDGNYCGHPAPARYGFQSYISMPIELPDGEFFGTLCAIDPRPARVNTPEIVGTFKLFAELIAFHLDANRRLAISEAALPANARPRAFVNSSSQSWATTCAIRWRASPVPHTCSRKSLFRILRKRWLASCGKAFAAWRASSMTCSTSPAVDSAADCR
jgi:hypothetical protein